MNLAFVPLVTPRCNEIRRRMKSQIRHAQLICPNFEDTIECRLAWEEVDELGKALDKEEQRELRTAYSERAERIYDE